MVLGRLLQYWDEASYCLIKSPYGQTDHPNIPPDIDLKGTYYKLEEPFFIALPGSNLFLKILRYIFNRSILPSLLRIIPRARKIKKILRSEEVRHVILCSGDFPNLPAGYLASKSVRIPFSLYYFDWYGLQWPTSLMRSIALWIEKKIVLRASSIIVPNESLQEELAAHYGVQSVVIHNPCSESSFAFTLNEVWPTNSESLRIIYTGAIYHAQMDAFINLCITLENLKGSKLSLHVYSSQSDAVLGIHGGSDRVTFYPHVSPEEAAEIQRSADILFLPLAFTSSIQEVLKTSAPGKMGEYLVSGRPILVHAPEDSFICRYFNKYECGSVVSENSPSKLLLGIQRIVDDEGFRHRIVTNALDRANKDYRPDVASERFKKVISSNL